MTTEKSNLRKHLEQLEDDIHKSWLRDLDKVESIQQITQILNEIHDSETIESYFEDQSDYEYFTKKFSHEVINNLLRQFNVYGTNGDDYAFELFFSYVKILLKFIENQNYAVLFETIKEIFDCTKSFYRGTNYLNKSLNEKKLITASRYNDSLPKKQSTLTNLVEGDEVDVLVDLKRSYSPTQERKIWVRGKIGKTFSNFVQIYVAEEPQPLILQVGSFDYTEKGKMTPEHDWRINLKKDDMVDGYDRGKWHPSTILSVKSELIHGLPKVDVKIAFRVYTKLCPNWNDYKKIWPEKSLTTDSNNEEYLGDAENMDETLPYYTKRISILNTMLNSNDTYKTDSDLDSYAIDDKILYEFEGKKTYIIARNNHFSYYFAQLVTRIIDINGFDRLIGLLTIKGRPNSDAIPWVFFIFNQCYSLFHKEYIKEIGPAIKDSVISYLTDFTEKEIRNIKKETIDYILKVLKSVLTHMMTIDERNKLLEQINVTFATKMLKTTLLDKRIQAVKTLVDIIKGSKGDSSKIGLTLKMIEESQIFHEIYGPNSHIQLINKSKELLEIMIQEDKLSDKEIDLIWSATKNGDLEGKLSILKTFKEISRSLKPKHINLLLESVYQSSGSDIINEEIELIYELSTHPSQSSSTIEKCIKFFTESILQSSTDEGEKINIMISKIVEITKQHSHFKSSVLNICLESLLKNVNSILAMKIISKFISNENLSTDEELKEILFNRNNLIEIFINNFTNYSITIKEKLKSWNQDIELIPLDSFNHSQHIRARLNFLNIIISNQLWKGTQIDPIDFLYEILIFNSNCENDNLEFYKWIKTIIENKVDSETEQKIFLLFNNKICKDLKGCQNLSIHAFDSYLKVFLNINQNQDKLSYFRNEIKINQKSTQYTISVNCDPETLIGFDILWKIIFDSFSNEIMNKGIETLHTLYTNIQFEGKDLNQRLLKKCIDLIKNQAYSEISDDEKFNIIVKCLKILKLMIEESEKKGTVRIKSHSGLIKRNVIQLKIIETDKHSTEHFIKVYSNTTIWDLKELISKKISVCVDFIRISLKKGMEIDSTDHGKTISEMKISDNDVIRVSRNTLDQLIPQAELTNNGEVVPQVMKIFNDWYDEYSTNDKMGKEDCARFVKAVTSNISDIPTEDPRIKMLFDSYDKNRDGILDREDFVGFYHECASKSDKRKVVWDNMKSMGIRNDLKRIDEPYELYNSDRNLLPRFILAQNEELFNTIFSLLDLNERIAKEASNFLYLISTNPTIYKEVLYGMCEKQNIDWEKQLNSKNIYKLIYSLQIIESFLEDIEIDTENIESFSNEEFILGLTQSEVQLKQQKILWIENFVLKGGVNHLVIILNSKFKEFANSLIKGDATTMMTSSIIYLLKIIRIFYFSSLNKFEQYRLVNSTDNNKEAGGDLIKIKSSGFELNEVENIFSGKIGDLIYESLDYHLLFDLFIQTLLILIKYEEFDFNAINLIETNFDFLTGILALSSVSEELENKLKGEIKEDFETIVFIGILNKNQTIRTIFSKSLIRLTKICNEFKRFKLISFVFEFIFKFLSNLSYSQEKLSTELFDFFSFLFEIYVLNPKDFESNFDQKTSVSPKEFFMELVGKLDRDINNDEGVPLSNELFIGYMKVINKVCSSVSEIKDEISTNYNLLEGIMTKVLFKQSAGLQEDKLNQLDFINPDKFDDSKTTRNSDITIRNECYNFILVILKGKISNFEKFFSVNLLDTTKEEKKKESVNKYSISMSHKCEGFVGLRNLCCICYMNSMLQQFFNVPSFRYHIMQVLDNQEPNVNPSNGVDDNFLHQVQRMFSFLDLSLRQDYNPFGFCYSFKDFDGKPTDVRIQQDSQEFLNRFFDKIEEAIKPTNSKYLLNSVFGGKTCSQLICENGCGSVKNRFEDFYNLSLEVNNMKTINDSLEKFISPERIEGFNCETCKKNVTITKRNSLAELPNVLIVHLQRIFYNYEIDRNEKINSRLEFPKTLNLKAYTIEDLTRRAVTSRSKGGNDESIEFETDDIYFKDSSYYEYHLVGTVVHSGTADAGHYYSYINTVRGGEDKEMTFSPNDDNHVNSWLEFNDSNIRKFNPSKLEDECFGGADTIDYDTTWGMKNEKSRSAYMLVYERRIKNPIKIKISPENVDQTSENILSFKEGEYSKIKKSFDLFKHINSPSLGEVYNKLVSTIFYDVAKDEYFKYKSFFSYERLIPKSYYLEISEDNSIFQKHQNISDEQFVSFFDSVISVLDETLKELKVISKETASKILSTFLNFIFKILSQKDKNKLLKAAKEKFLHILNLAPESLVDVIQYLNDNLKLLNDVIFNESTNIVQNHCELLYEIIEKVFQSNPNEFRNSIYSKNYNSKKSSDIALKIIDLIFSQFPRIPVRFVSKVGPVLQFFYNLTNIDSSIIEYLISRESITIFVTFVLGRDSPYYLDTLLKGDNWDFGRYSIEGVESIIQLIYKLFRYSRNQALEAKNPDDVLELSERDINCVRNSSFLKYVYKHSEAIFSELITVLSVDNEDYSVKICGEIAKYIDDITGYDDHEFRKLYLALVPLLSLEDDYQLIRLETLLGFPSLLMDDPNLKSPFPYFGFNRMNDESSKVYEFRGLHNNRRSCTIIKKLLSLKYKERVPCEFFLTLLESGLKYKNLFIYLDNLLAEEPYYGKFINWGSQKIENYENKNDNSKGLGVRLYEIQSNWIQKKLELENEKINGFTGFGLRNYLPTFISQEIFTLQMQNDGLFLFKVEYLTTYSDYGSSSLDYSKTRINTPLVISSSIEDRKEIETFSLSQIPDNHEVLNSDRKLTDERNFLRSNMNLFENSKSLIIFNNKFNTEDQVIRSTVIRYVLLNNTSRDVNFTFNIRRKNIGYVNEYIPSSSIITEVNSNSTKNIYCMTKFNPEEDWSELELSAKSEIIQYSYNSYSNHDKTSSVKMLTFSGNPKYVAYTNTSYDPSDIES